MTFMHYAIAFLLGAAAGFYGAMQLCAYLIEWKLKRSNLCADDLRFIRDQLGIPQ